MSQRLFDTVNWIWCLLVLNSGVWSTVKSVTVRTPPNVPSTIEAQAKFFQYRHLPTSEDFDQGHRLGSERHFVERHERSRPATGLFSAKVRWGDKKGGYGEHYWDLNHAGHTGDRDSYDDSDDGSYREDPSETYNNSDDASQNYGTGDYDPEITSHYEESDRKKRAHGKIKTTTPRNESQDDEEEEEEEKEILPKEKPKVKRPQNKGDYKPKLEDIYTEEDQSEELINRRTTAKPKRKLQEKKYDDIKLNRQKNNIVLVINQKEKKEQEPPKQTEPTRFVPYEGGAGVRQHVRPEIASAASIPRLFLEASTGRVVDRTTGQAYVLQPVPHVNYS